MTNKEFIQALAQRTAVDVKGCVRLVDSLLNLMGGSLNEGKTVAVQGFGNLELKRKAERKMYNPVTKEFKTVPGKTVANYKMSPVLKDRINNP